MRRRNGINGPALLGLDQHRLMREMAVNDDDEVPTPQPVDRQHARSERIWLSLDRLFTTRNSRKLYS
jgi:hypothetical protein